MPISQGLTTSFKVGLLTASFNFNAGTYKLALYGATADIGPSTTAYTAVGEISGTGYTAGGATITVTTAPTSTGTTAFFGFSNATWTGASFVARGGLIYLANGTTNPSIAVLDFGSDKVATPAVPFVVTMPPPTATSALIRLP
jgi:hypothetical protein